MKKLFIALSLISVFFLQGCFMGPMITKDSKDKMVAGFVFEVSNYNKIHDKTINLTFELDEKINIGEFSWLKTQNKIKKHLRSKGVILSVEGRPVTITLNNFILKGSNHAKINASKTGVLSEVTKGLGGSVIQQVVAGRVEKKIYQSTEDKTQGDGKRFVPELTFIIKSNDYETTIKMLSYFARATYNYDLSRFSASALSEFFVPE